MNKRLFAIILIVVIAAISRLLPHPFNFTPLAAIALFAGAYITNRYWAIIIPLLAMLFSDALMGFNGWVFIIPTITVYATFVLITLLGFILQNNKGILKIGALSITGSVIFFITTNFAVWFGGYFYEPAFYPMNTAGLVECYKMGIPFFRNTLAGDLFYNAVLFGGFYLLQINIPALAIEKK